MTIEQELMNLMEDKQESADIADPSKEEQEPVVKIENPLDPNYQEDGIKDAQEDEEELEDAKEKDDEKVAAYKQANESVTDLLVGEELSEEFKFKAATLFEAAVKNQVEEIRQTLTEEFDQKNQSLNESFEEKVRQLDEQFETSLTEAKQEFKQQLSEKIDAYLDNLAEQWMKQNEVALEHGLKTELTESFIDGMKTLFEAHYVDLPEEKYDVISEMEKQNAELQKTLAEQVQHASELKSKYDSITRDVIISEAAKGLTDLDEARLQKLVEDVNYESEESFKKRVSLIKESFFRTANQQVVTEDKKVVVDTKPLIEEKELEIDSGNDPMAAYLKLLSRK